MIEGFPSNAAGVQERAGTYRASLFTGYNKLRANGYLNWSSGIHNLRWQTRFISSTTQVETNSIALAAALKLPESAISRNILNFLSMNLISILTPRLTSVLKFHH